MYVYVCIYVHIHLCIFLYIRTCTYLSMFMYVLTHKLNRKHWEMYLRFVGVSLWYEEWDHDCSDNWKVDSLWPAFVQGVVSWCLWKVRASFVHGIGPRVICEEGDHDCFDNWKMDSLGTCDQRSFRECSHDASEKWGQRFVHGMGPRLLWGREPRLLWQLKVVFFGEMRLVFL